MKQTVKAECRDCGASGVYCGMAESKGTAVVCLTCGGSGCVDMKYTPFTQRKIRQNIETVFASKGSFIGTGVGPEWAISYHDFLNGKLP
jgi:glutamine amidotransferase-like uncharacterized protein